MGAILWHNFRSSADVSVHSPLDDSTTTPYWWLKGTREALKACFNSPYRVSLIWYFKSCHCRSATLLVSMQLISP
jgi:hypothetical protein